jgi:hypothetical protein
VPHSRIEEHFISLNEADTSNPHKYSPELLARLKVTPFNPIPRDAFPVLVRIKLPKLLRSLHEKVGCETFTIADQDREPIINYLVNALYGDGTDVRKLSRYFDSIYQTICEQAQTWGHFKNREMALIPLGQGLGISCKETLYGQLVQAYAPAVVNRG